MRRVIALMVMVAIGLGFYLYPQANQWNQLRIERGRNAAVVTINEARPAQVNNQLISDAIAYNKNLWNGENPYYLEEDAATDTYYQKQLVDPDRPATKLVGDGTDTQMLTPADAMARVSIPKINVSLPVYHGATEDVLSMGAGHVYGTSLPVGGESTHTVLTAHSRQGEAGRFNRIREMVVGDEFYVVTAGQTMRYVVDAINVVTPDQSDYLQVIPGEDHATLLTCTPLGINTHRLLVRGVRADLDPLPTAAPPLAPMPFPMWSAWLLGGVAVAGIAGAIINKVLTPKVDTATARSMTEIETVPRGRHLRVPAPVAIFLGLTLLFGRGLALPLAEAAAPVPLPAPGSKGSITVVKQMPDATQAPQTTFQVQQVLSVWGRDADLTRSSGWQLLDDIGVFTDDPAAAADPAKAAEPIGRVFAAIVAGNANMGTALSGTTDADGRAVFANLPVGLYLVQETGSAGQKAEPILVSLPYPDPATLQWLPDAVPTPKVTQPPQLPGPDAALRIWSQRIYQPVADGGWQEVWNFDTAPSVANLARDVDGAPIEPKPPIDVQIGDAIQYELQLHNQGDVTLHIDEITFHSVPGLVLATEDIHPGQRNHVWAAMPEHGYHSHIYVVPEENLTLQPGEYHQLAFTAVVTPEVSTINRFTHWQSEDDIFDIWAEISGISVLAAPVELHRVGPGRSVPVPVVSLSTRLLDAVGDWVSVLDVDSDHYYDNTFDPDTYLDNEIWQDQRNGYGDKDNHDGDHARLVPVRVPEPEPQPTPRPTRPAISASGTVEPMSPGARGLAAVRSALSRTGVQVGAIVISASLLMGGMAAMRRRSEGGK